MAKKKTNAQSQAQENSNDKPTKTVEEAPSMEEEEKLNPKKELASLKALNAMLLKETVERRHQVDSLIVSNGSLESELSRSEMEKKALQDELNRLSDQAVMLEIEGGLVSSFVSVQGKQQAEVVGEGTVGMKEKMESLESEMKRVLGEKGEIEKEMSDKELEIWMLKRRVDELAVEIVEKRGISIRAGKERDEIKAKLDKQIEETNGLIEKLREAEEREMEIGYEVEKLEMAIVEVKEEKERSIELILREKDSIERRLAESEKEIEELRREIEELLREKKVMEEKMGVGEREKYELANTVTGLNEMIASLKAEEEMLRENVAALENRCAEGLEKERHMGITIDGLLEEKNEREKIFESLIHEKDLIERRLAESEKELRGEIDELLREKKVIEEKTGMGEREKHELANTVSGLNEMVANLKDEGEMLHGNVTDLEKRCAEGLEKERQMGMEIDGLLEEKNEREKIFESLIHEKSLVMNDLIEMKKNLDFQMQKLEQISQEKIEIEEAKCRGENEIVELKKQLREFKDTIQSQEESSLGQTDKLKQLESEVSHYRAAFDRATTEKTEAKEGLNEEKVNGMKLREKISEMEKSIQQMEKVLSEMEAESANLKGQKNEFESRCSLLMKTITSLENQLAESQKEHNNIKAKVGLADAHSERVLNMLRNTASVISPSNVLERSIGTESLVFDQDKGDVEEVKPYVEELEAIKKAFEGRESKIEEMKRQLEFLENSAAEAYKGKGFWTLVSSATILAAASIAYVARAH